MSQAPTNEEPQQRNLPDSEATEAGRHHTLREPSGFSLVPGLANLAALTVVMYLASDCITLLKLVFSPPLLHLALGAAREAQDFIAYWLRHQLERTLL